MTEEAVPRPYSKDTGHRHPPLLWKMFTPLQAIAFLGSLPPRRGTEEVLAHPHSTD